MSDELTRPPRDDEQAIDPTVDKQLDVSALAGELIVGDPYQ